MLRLVRRPTRWTFLALALYVAILWMVYRFGASELDDERNSWFATPFMLVPFVLPTFIRREWWMFFGSYTFCAFYGAALIARDWPPFGDFNLFMYYTKVAPTGVIDALLGWKPHSLPWCLMVDGADDAVFSLSYGLTSVLAAKTYALRYASNRRG